MSNFEFDTAYSAITGEHVPGVYIPPVQHDSAIDLVIDHVWHADSARYCFTSHQPKD